MDCLNINNAKQSKILTDICNNQLKKVNMNTYIYVAEVETVLLDTKLKLLPGFKKKTIIDWVFPV